MIIIIGLMVSVFIFFVKTDAPITNGNIQFGIPFNASQRLDVYEPTKKVYEKSPVILFIHGGAWIAGRKEAINVNRFNGAINTLRDHGYTVISPGYTLARDEKSPFPECIIDGYDAIQWIAIHADSLQLDLNNFGIMGESAGGHIAMMNAFAPPSDFGLKIPHIKPRYVVDVYGPNHLWKLYNSSTVDSIEALIASLPSSLQENFNLPKMLFGFDPEADTLRTRQFADTYSPIHYIHTGMPPTLIIHGIKDRLVPIQQSISLKARLDSLHIESEIHVLQNVDHAFFGATEAQKDSIQVWISNFIIRHYYEN